MRSMTASHPDYEDINDAQFWLCVAINPQCWWLPDGVDLPEPEHKALVQTLEQELDELLEEENLFREHVDTI